MQEYIKAGPSMWGIASPWEGRELLIYFYICSALTETLMEGSEWVMSNVPVLSCGYLYPMDMRLAGWGQQDLGMHIQFTLRLGWNRASALRRGASCSPSPDRRLWGPCQCPSSELRSFVYEAAPAGRSQWGLEEQIKAAPSACDGIGLWMGVSCALHSIFAVHCRRP